MTYRADELWAAITEPEQNRGWLAEAVLDLQSGDWPDGERMAGEITEWAPPRALEYTWHERLDRGRVRFELEHIADGTLVTFDHSDIPVSALIGMSAGWHAHLDWLRAHTAGRRLRVRPALLRAAPALRGCACRRCGGQLTGPRRSRHASVPLTRLLGSDPAVASADMTRG